MKKKSTPKKISVQTIRNESYEECAVLLDRRAEELENTLPNSTGGDFAKRFHINGLAAMAVEIRKMKRGKIK